MPNILGMNIDLTPGFSGRQVLDNMYRSNNAAANRTAGAIGYVRDVLDPNVNVIGGLGPNEMRRNAVPTGGGSGIPSPNQEQDQQIAEWGSWLNGGGGGGGGGSLSRNATQMSDPDTARAYQDMIDQLNGQVGRLDGQLNTGLGNIANSYNLQSNRLNEQKGVARRNYDTQTQQNTQNYSNTRNSVLSNTRATANALQRLLGLNGAGNSSAAQEMAPYAAGLQGTQNLNAAQQTYGNNRSSLDTSWEDTQRGYNNAFQDLDQQKYSQENNLRSQIAQTRAGLLEKLGSAQSNRALALGQNYNQARAARTPFQNEINSLLDQMAGLGNQFANPILKTGDVSFKAPTLNDFSAGRQAQIANQTGGGGNLDPTFVNLLARDDDERNRIGF